MSGVGDVLDSGMTSGSNSVGGTYRHSANSAGNRNTLSPSNSLSGGAAADSGGGGSHRDFSPASLIRRNQSIQRFNTLNPNAYWMNSKGAWLTYVCLIFLLHLALLAVPWFGTDLAWTLTNVIHGVAIYIYFHHIKGLPFDSTNFDPDCSFRLTLWEQLDDGKQYTDTRKFLICVPIVLFIMVSFYTKHQWTFFLINFIVLMFNLIPKLPYLHKKRLFGINKY